MSDNVLEMTVHMTRWQAETRLMVMSNVYDHAAWLRGECLYPMNLNKMNSSGGGVDLCQDTKWQTILKPLDRHTK